MSSFSQADGCANYQICRNMIDPSKFFLDYYNQKVCETCINKNLCQDCKVGFMLVNCDCNSCYCFDCAWKHYFENKSHSFNSKKNYFILPGRNKLEEICTEIYQSLHQPYFNKHPNYSSCYQTINNYRENPKKSYFDEINLFTLVLESYINFFDNKKSKPKQEHLIFLAKNFFSMGCYSKAITSLSKISDPNYINEKLILILNHEGISHLKEELKDLKAASDRILYDKNQTIEGYRITTAFNYFANKSVYKDMLVQLKTHPTDNHTGYLLLDYIRSLELEDLNEDIITQTIHLISVYHQEFCILSNLYELLSDFYANTRWDFLKAIQSLETSLELSIRHSLNHAEVQLPKLYKLSKLLIHTKSPDSLSAIVKFIKISKQHGTKDQIIKGCKLLKKYLIESPKNLQYSSIINSIRSIKFPSINK